MKHALPVFGLPLIVLYVGACLVSPLAAVALCLVSGWLLGRRSARARQHAKQPRFATSALKFVDVDEG